MRKLPFIVSLAATAMLLPLFAVGQAVSPAKGQTPDQQKSDEAECYTSAVQQSGYDPAKPPPATTAQPAPVTGSGGRARGAAAGAAVGAIGGNDVGNAAAKGAVVGGVAQRNRNRNAAAASNQASADQQAGVGSYQKARQACLEGRGYTACK